MDNFANKETTETPKAQSCFFVLIGDRITTNWNIVNTDSQVIYILWKIIL